MPGIYYTRRDKGSILTAEEAMMLDDLMIAHLLPDGVSQDAVRAGWRDYPFAVTTPEGSLYAPVWKSWEDDFRKPAFEHGRRTDFEGAIHLDHDYVPGSMVYPHIHWTLNTDNAGVVRWIITWKFARRADSPTGITRYTAAQQLVMETVVPANSAGKHLVSEPATGFGMLHADFDVDSVILIRGTRDGEHTNDTFEADAFVTFGDAHARVDKIGTIGRTPPFLVDN